MDYLWFVKKNRGKAVFDSEHIKNNWTLWTVMKW